MRGFGRYKTLDWVKARNLALEILGHSLVPRKRELDCAESSYLEIPLDGGSNPPSSTTPGPLKGCKSY